MAEKPRREDLVEKLNTPGWEAEPGHKGTLEKLVRTAHDKRGAGKTPNLIRQIETGIELDAIQIAELWEHLGLPV